MQTHELPMYSARMAGRLVGISKDRVRRWVKGYDFSLPSRNQKVSQKPVIQRDYEGDSPFVTFIELIDLLFVKQFLDFGFSLQKIRNALHEVEENIGHKHFANETFFTDSKAIYLQIRDRLNYQNSAILELLSDGQWVIEPIIKELSLKVDFNEINHIANRWYPLGRNGLIIIDPKISFGRPTIINRGMATDNIYDLYLGESKNIKNVCGWMNIEKKEVEAAILFEEKLNAA